MAYITAINGPESGRRYELTAGQTLGRHPDCQIHVDVGAVSREHARILLDDARFFVEDLKSRNGTFINDQRVEGRYPLALKNGDEVRICDIAFLFETDEPTPPSQHGATATIAGTPHALVGSGTVVFDDGDDDSSSTIMSKLDVSSSSGRIQITAGPEAKLAAMIEITRSLGKAISLDEVFPQVLNSLFKIFVQADRGFIVMRADDGKLMPMWTKMRREDAQETIRISRTIVRQVMESREAILSADAAADERFDMSESIADFRIRSMMCTPLVDSEGSSMGVLQIDTQHQRKRFVKNDLEVLAAVAAQAGIAIDNARMHERALQQREVERDLQVAHEVQRGFLPQRPPALPGYSFYDYYEPANHVGGDYYDYIALPDGRLAAIVADVVGHGIAAALLMAKLSAEARYCLAIEPRADTAMTKLNDALSRLGLDRFITMVMAVINPASGEVAIANAGHMAPLVRRADGRLEEPSGDIAGLPLGISEGLDYRQETIVLGRGEKMVMYTDGVNECAGEDGEMYGIDRLREVVSGFVGADPGRLGETIIDDVRRFLNQGQQEDDMCLVCLGRE